MSGVSPKKYRFHQEVQYLPAGSYLVTDPCYIFGEDPFWGDLCQYFPSGRGTFYCEVDGRQCFIFSTQGGDGSFPVGDGHVSGNVPVDAGLLSLIPWELVEAYELGDTGLRVTLDHAAQPDYEDGDVVCANVEILTDTVEEPEEWDMEPEDDDDDRDD